MAKKSETKAAAGAPRGKEEAKTGFTGLTGLEKCVENNPENPVNPVSSLGASASPRLKASALVDTRVIIIPLTVKEILDEQIARKLA